jgi:hypothetical protein
MRLVLIVTVCRPSPSANTCVPYPQPNMIQRCTSFKGRPGFCCLCSGCSVIDPSESDYTVDGDGVAVFKEPVCVTDSECDRGNLCGVPAFSSSRRICVEAASTSCNNTGLMYPMYPNSF